MRTHPNIAPMPFGLHPKICKNGPSGRPLRLFGSSFPAALPCVGRSSVAHWSFKNCGIVAPANRGVASTNTAAKPWILRESDQVKKNDFPKRGAVTNRKTGGQTSKSVNEIPLYTRRTHGGEMPVNVTMEEPRTGVVSDEPQSGRMHRQYLDCVTADRVSLTLLQRRVQCGIVRSVVTTTVDNLEPVTVKVAIPRKFQQRCGTVNGQQGVQRMLSCVTVFNYDINNREVV